MLVKFEQAIQNFELFDKIMVNPSWQSVDANLEDVSVTEKNLFDAKLLI